MPIHKIFHGEIITKGILDTYRPPTYRSSRWKNWVTIIDLKTCLFCISMNGKIFAMNEKSDVVPPVHWYCRCVIEAMKAVLAGQGTKDANNGADWWLKYHGILPDYYITAAQLQALGWRHGKAPAKYAPDKMVTMGIYLNKDGHLPHTLGRIWYEADINYYRGKRNAHRILWSNDGLIFVTYDHYATFMEIV